MQNLQLYIEDEMDMFGMIGRRLVDGEIRFIQCVDGDVDLSRHPISLRADAMWFK